MEASHAVAVTQWNKLGRLVSSEFGIEDPTPEDIAELDEDVSYTEHVHELERYFQSMCDASEVDKKLELIADNTLACDAVIAWFCIQFEQRLRIWEFAYETFQELSVVHERLIDGIDTPVAPKPKNPSSYNHEEDIKKAGADAVLARFAVELVPLVSGDWKFAASHLWSRKADAPWTREYHPDRLLGVSQRSFTEKIVEIDNLMNPKQQKDDKAKKPKKLTYSALEKSLDANSPLKPYVKLLKSIQKGHRITLLHRYETLLARIVRLDEYRAASKTSKTRSATADRKDGGESSEGEAEEYNGEDEFEAQDRPIDAIDLGSDSEDDVDAAENAAEDAAEKAEAPAEEPEVEDDDTGATYDEDDEYTPDADDD